MPLTPRTAQSSKRCTHNMEPNLASVVRDWHDFYGLVGTASATLVGLMFVAASVGASVFSASQQEPMKAYLTPTVAHFSSPLFICISPNVAFAEHDAWRPWCNRRCLFPAAVDSSVLYPPLPHQSGRSHLLCLRSWPRLFAGRRFRRCVIRTSAVECRADGPPRLLFCCWLESEMPGI